MSVALVGYTRFPIFYSADGSKILGSRSDDPIFDRYVKSLRMKHAVAIYSLAKIHYRRRFVIENKAINPDFTIEEQTPKCICIFPNKEQVVTLSNIYAMGFTLKGTRNPVYVPMLSLRYLEQNEVDALLNVVKVKDFPMERMEEFIRSLGISFEKKELGVGIAFTISDPSVSGRYQVLTDAQGRVLDTNFCITIESSLYLPELVMLTRESRYLDIFPQRW